MKIKVKKLHRNAVIPHYAVEGDAGMDLVATTKMHDKYGNLVFGTGLAFEIPEGYVGLIFPRSSICKTTHMLTNAVGVIDSGYRGEVTLKFKAALKDVQLPIFDANSVEEYEVGDRVGQIMILPYPHVLFEEAEELSDTRRGTGGYGHTGK